MAAALLTSSFVARGAVRPARLSTSNGSRTVMKAGNWWAVTCLRAAEPCVVESVHASLQHQTHSGNLESHPELCQIIN